MRILLTGNKGYIGTNFLPMLVERYPDAEIVLCDLKDGQDYVNFCGETFDVAILLGAFSSVMECTPEKSDYMLDHNAFHLIPFLTKNQIGKVIFPSSGGTQYGECEKPAKEEDARWAGCICTYSQSKYIAERIIRGLHPNHTILRLSNVFGGNMDIRSEALSLVHFRHDDPIVVYGGNQTRDFVHINIVAGAIFKAMESDIVGTFTIASGTSIGLLDLAKQLSEQRGGIPIEMAPHRPQEIVKLFLDVSKAKAVGLIPQVIPPNDYNS